MSTVTIWNADPKGDCILPHFEVGTGDLGVFGSYLADIADQMGLRDWRFILVPDNPNTDPDSPYDVYAYIECTFGQRVAKIQFAYDIREWQDEKIRHVVCHELIHCHLDRMDTHYNNIACELGMSARRLSDSSWRSNLEDATDNMARAWCESLPLIEWPERSGIIL